MAVPLDGAATPAAPWEERILKLARLLSVAALAVSVAAVTAGYGPLAAAHAATSQPAAAAA
jgi:hypothetical protein